RRPSPGWQQALDRLIGTCVLAGGGAGRESGITRAVVGSAGESDRTIAGLGRKRTPDSPRYRRAPGAGRPPARRHRPDPRKYRARRAVRERIMRALVIGGGIGGLTAALALHVRGIEVLVFESVEEIRPLGVGINLLPHGARELIGLGLGPALFASAIETRALKYLTRYG